MTIQKVVHAYKNLIPNSYGNLGGSLSCNNNIACFPAWDEESDAVALVLLSNGVELCSGALIMTTDQSFQPYFLSAFHCIDEISPHDGLSITEISNAENWMFKFQYKMTSCEGSSATTGITYNGAQYRAAWNRSDCVLMEINNFPHDDFRFSWLGWDRRGNTPTSGTGIHHPSGDVMKISFDYDNLTTNESQLSWSNGTTFSANTHWVVGFDSGTTEGGSSGSPLFDENKRVIGQLHGGSPGCPPVTKYYGRIDSSWVGGGTETTRLSDWLDPCGSGIQTTNTARPPYITGPITVEDEATYTLANFPEGATVSWTTSNSNLQLVSGQGTSTPTFESSYYGQCTLYAVISSQCNSIMTLEYNVTADFDIYDVYIDGPDFACGTSATFTMRNLPQPATISWNNQSSTADTVYTVNISNYSGNPGVAKVTASANYKGKIVDLDYNFSFNYPGTCYVEDTVMCNNGFYYDAYRGVAGVYVSYLYPASGITYEWSCNNNWTLVSGGTDYAQFEGPPTESNIDVKVCFNNPCGQRTCLVRELYMPQEMLSLMITPNPTASEATVSIGLASAESSFSKDQEWSLEVYDARQTMKTKVTRIKGNSAKIQTNGWIEGVYLVRAVFKNKILTGKLVVKR